MMLALPRRLWPRLRAWLGLGRKRKAPARTAGSAARRARAEFVNTVRRMLAANPGLETRLHIISLADFRESVGPKWPRLSEKVAMIVEALIRLHIGAGNLHAREGEDTFLLLFPTASRDDARQRVAAITREISRRLLGDGVVGGERPLALMANVALAEAAAGGTIDAAVVREAVDEARGFLPHLGDGHAAEAMRWEPIEVVRTGGEAVWEEMQTERRPTLADAWGSVGPLPPGAALSLLWRPTWVAESEAISAYTARVVRLDQSGDEPLEGTMAYPEAHPATSQALDRFVVGTAVRQLRGAGQGTSVVIPISWESLVSDDRMAVIAPFADLSPTARALRVRVEVFHIPELVPLTEMEKVVQAINSLGCQAMLRMRLAAGHAAVAADAGAALVGIDLSELPPEQRMGDDALVEALEGMLHEVGARGKHCYLWSARRRRVVGRVVRNGFAMVNGPGLMKDVGRPAMVVPAPKERFAA